MRRSGSARLGNKRGQAILNELYFFLSIAVYFSLLLAAYRFFGKTGLFVWICVAMIVSNIEAAKLVTMFGVSVTLGNVVYGSTYLATDILCEIYGQKEANRTVMLGFFVTVAFVAMTQLTLLFVPAEGDFAHESLKTVFSITPRLTVASIVTYLLMQRFDIWLYSLIRKKTGEKRLWLRNNLATITTQLLDSALFTMLAFTGVHPFGTVVELIFTTYLVKIIVSLADTPFLYLARKLKPVSDDRPQTRPPDAGEALKK